jgi:hypothetical protein
MSRSWKNTKSGIRDFENSLRKGMTVWTINEHATNIAGQFEKYTTSSHTCTGRSPVTGNWMFGPMSAKSLLCGSVGGQVFERQPVGYRDLASPEPDCRDEGWAGLRRGQTFQGTLHADDIKAMEYEADQAADRYKDDRKSGRRGWGFGR